MSRVGTLTEGARRETFLVTTRGIESPREFLNWLHSSHRPTYEQIERRLENQNDVWVRSYVQRLQNEIDRIKRALITERQRMMIMIQSKPVFECEEMKQKLARLERENDELKRENDELKRANRTNSHITNLHNPCLPPLKWIDFIYEELQKIYSSLTQKLTDIQKGSNNKDKRNM